MYLLLGSPQDPCCLSVHAALEARGYPARILENPLTHPVRFSWRLDNECSASQLVQDEEQPVTDKQISGVLVRGMGWNDPTGWQTDDWAYMQAETQAALLAWLWSLPCPVVNCYPAAIWYRPQMSLLSWQPLLWRCSLPVSEALVSNVAAEAHAFRRRLADQGIAGAIYGPITSDARYLVVSDDDWAGLATMQARAPVCLTHPHGEPRLACVVGGQVVWEGAAPPEANTLEPALCRFAAVAGLAFVEVVLAPATNGLCVVAVEHHPRYEHFGDAARQEIVAGLVQLLTESDTARQLGATRQSSHH
jgi:hypothetical protein